MSDLNESAPLVIQCPNPECGTTKLMHIYICEQMPVLWNFKTDGHRLIADTATQYSGDCEERTRHLYCELCSAEWKVPTLAKVDWI